MGFIDGLVHTCNIVCSELITPQTGNRDSKQIPGYGTPKTIANHSSMASHKSRRGSDSSTYSSEPPYQSHRSILDSRSEPVTPKASSESKKIPLSGLDSQSGHLSTDLDSQSEHVSTSPPLDSSSEQMPSKLLASKRATRKLLKVALIYNLST